MPSLNPALLRYMAGLPGKADAIVPRWIDKAGHPQLETLHAVYSRRCIAPIRQRITAGNLQVNRLFEEITTHYIDEEELRRFNPNLRSFRNLNTPEDMTSDE